MLIPKILYSCVFSALSLAFCVFSFMMWSASRFLFVHYHSVNHRHHRHRLLYHHHHHHHRIHHSYRMYRLPFSNSDFFPLSTLCFHSVIVHFSSARHSWRIAYSFRYFFPCYIHLFTSLFIHSHSQYYFFGPCLNIHHCTSHTHITQFVPMGELFFVVLFYLLFFFTLYRTNTRTVNVCSMVRQLTITCCTCNAYTH